MNPNGFHQGFLHWRGRRTWYAVADGGSTDGSRLPLVICHGGPGLSHDYLTTLAELTGTGRCCVFYDQFGSGRSGHRSDVPAEFWSIELFCDELAELVDLLNLRDGYHLFGHSWGGMLALEYALRDGAGLRSLVLADTFSSAPRYVREVRKLLNAILHEVGIPADHPLDSLPNHPEWPVVQRLYFERHVCRLRPVPDVLQRTIAAVHADPTVYRATTGGSEFTLHGALAQWDVTERLASISVPTLVISGRHDQVTPDTVSPLSQHLPSAVWQIFEHSSHMPHLEERQRFMVLVSEFLLAVDRVGVDPSRR